MIKEYTLVTWNSAGAIEIHDVHQPVKMFEWYVRDGEYERVMAVATWYECEYAAGKSRKTALRSSFVLNNWSRS